MHQRGDWQSAWILFFRWNAAVRRCNNDRAIFTSQRAVGGRKMRLARVCAVSLVVVTLAVGCGDDSGDSMTVTIGVLAPLDAGLTQFGRGIRNSVQLAADEAR